MIEGRFRQETMEWHATAGGDVLLVSHETWMRVGMPGSGFGVSYRRPVRVVSGDGNVVVAIRDHVMITLVAALIVGLGFAIWRLMR